ncbi:FCSD flavin-binding domain-containing protein [Thiorhodospira sibirica]|uniref:FCSD flavin-binding domain-containing protein n=1 Tax=Thiorhodospira sibirica TaxID=154347 RepID=UPI00022C282A|nr:FCSD flavin-binding domain-containing protein [Thiorhodospira sibirica]
MAFTRRDFIKTLGIGGGATLLSGCVSMSEERNNSAAKVVVIGGGSGGATVAKYLKHLEPALSVTLVEPTATFHTCYGSNWVIGGFKQMADIAQSYGNLQDKYGVRVVRDRAIAIEADKHQVRLAGGTTLNYDKLVVSPGIDFRFDAVAGYNKEDAQRIPHAYQAGEQTVLLRKQLEAMPDGGTFILVAPGNPFRCPPGPYERASLVAHYFKQHKPRAKVLILDNKENFSKQGLFVQGWKELYGEMIEWVPASQGGQVEEIDVNNKTLFSDAGFNEFKGDVINYIPPQRAGQIAADSGLTDPLGWCPVDQKNFASTQHADIYVIGDASMAGEMPKSGHSANTQGKVVAVDIIRRLREQESVELSAVNTCYSLLTPDYAITVAAVYKYIDGSIRGVPGAGGVSPMDVDREFRRTEAYYAQGWYDSITDDIWG